MKNIFKRLAALEAARQESSPSDIIERLTDLLRCGDLWDNGTEFAPGPAAPAWVARIAELLNLCRQRRAHATA